MFELHPQLAADCLHVGDFDLCRLLLVGDSRYPWFILVPRRPGISEIYELCGNDQQALIAESSRLAERLAEAFKPDKLNIAAIGNVVPQLHLHHVARFVGDAAWPGPIWGRLPPVPYEPSQREGVIGRLDAPSLDGFRPVS